MATLSRTDAGWTNTTAVEQTSQNAIYTFSTGNKYVDKDIKFNIKVPGIILKKPSSGTNTFYIEVEGDGTRYTWTVDSSGNIWIE